jgi:hypothetical protein
MRPELFLDRSRQQNYAETNPMNFAISSRAYLCLAMTALVLMVSLDVAAEIAAFSYGHPSIYGLARLVRMDFEANFPSVASGLNILFAAGLLAALARNARCSGDPLWRGWAVLAVTFAFLGIDELVSIHEIIGHSIRASTGMEDRSLRLWVIPYLALAACVGFFCLQLLRGLSTSTRNRFILSGTIFVVGAAGIESVGGYYLELLGGRQNLTYAILTTVEETMELAGMILFVHSVLRHVECERIHLALRVGQTGESPG